MKRPPARANGFSLVELAVALAIVGFLLGGLILPLSAQSEIRTRRETEKALADIRDALLGFAVMNGRLPCPAAATVPAGTAGAGVEVLNTGASTSSCACAGASNVASGGGNACSTPTVIGVLPWGTLGLPETDAWGRRYTYSLDAQFGRAPGQDTFGCTPSVAPLRTGFALCSTPHIALVAAAGGPKLVSDDVPAIVVSHGKNGYGAYTPQGGRIASTDASVDEVENANGDTVFVSNSNSDDQSVWIPTPILMHRMLSAGMLP